MLSVARTRKLSKQQLLQLKLKAVQQLKATREEVRTEVLITVLSRPEQTAYISLSDSTKSYYCVLETVAMKSRHQGLKRPT